MNTRSDVTVRRNAVTSIDQVREIVAKSVKSVAPPIGRYGGAIFVPVRVA